MTWRDKLEIGLKDDAPFREDNLPDAQITGKKIDAGPGRSPIVKDALALAKSKRRPRRIPKERRS